jgi:hypothetical protein
MKPSLFGLACFTLILIVSKQEVDCLDQCVTDTGSYLTALTGQLNKATSLGQFVSTLNLVPLDLVQYGAQVVLAAFYKKHGVFSFIATTSTDPSAAFYKSCQSQLTLLVDNLLVRGGANLAPPNISLHTINSTCTVMSNVTLRWQDTDQSGTSFNWGPDQANNHEVYLNKLKINYVLWPVTAP